MNADTRAILDETSSIAIIAAQILQHPVDDLTDQDLKSVQESFKLLARGIKRVRKMEKRLLESTRTADAQQG